MSDLLLKMSHFLMKGEIGNVSANLNPNLANLSLNKSKHLKGRLGPRVGDVTFFAQKEVRWDSV